MMTMTILKDHGSFEIQSVTFASPLDLEKYTGKRRSPNMRIKFGFGITPGV